MTWDIKEFYKLAQQKLLPQTTSSLMPPLFSISWKFKLCDYHIKEINHILSEMFTWPKEKQFAEAVGKVLMRAAGTDEGLEFAKGCFYTEAHVIAFAQALHSIADILAQVLYISLKLDRFLKKKQNLYLYNVVDCMIKHNIAPAVVTAATRFRDSDEFSYLRAYVNTIKHTSLIDSRYSIGLVPGQEKHGLKINSFEYDSKTWPQKWVADFIGADFERLSSMFDAIGIELTAFLRSQQSPSTST